MKIGDRTTLPDGRSGAIVTLRGGTRGGRVYAGVRLDEGGYVSLYLQTGQDSDRLVVTDIAIPDAYELAQLVVGGATVTMPVQSQVLLLAHALIAVGRP